MDKIDKHQNCVYLKSGDDMPKWYKLKLINHFVSKNGKDYYSVIYADEEIERSKKLPSLVEVTHLGKCTDLINKCRIFMGMPPLQSPVIKNKNLLIKKNASSKQPLAKKFKPMPIEGETTEELCSDNIKGKDNILDYSSEAEDWDNTSDYE